MTENRRADRTFGGLCPARALANGDRLQRIRRRVAERAYDDPAVVALVARALLDSGDLL